MWAVSAVPPDEADLMTKNLPLVTDINYHRSFLDRFYSVTILNVFSVTIFQTEETIETINNSAILCSVFYNVRKNRSEV